MREERESLARLLEEERADRRRLQERLEEAQRAAEDRARPWWRGNRPLGVGLRQKMVLSEGCASLLRTLRSVT